MATEHHFNIEDAVNYGVEAAVLLYNLRFWLAKNKANKHNIHDGRVWTYNTQEAWLELFPYLTRSKIQRIIKDLHEKGLLLKGNYNKNRFEKTVWYSLNEAEFETENYTTENDETSLEPPKTSIARNRAVDGSKPCNRALENVQSLTDNKQTDKKLSKSVNNTRELNFADRVITELQADSLPVSKVRYAKLKIREYQERYPDSESVADCWSYVVTAVNHQMNLTGS